MESVGLSHLSGIEASPLDSSIAEPLYAQLAARIAAQISSGQLRAGQQLPSESMLMDAYGISRVTVRQALLQLTRTGQLVAKRGKGIGLRLGVRTSGCSGVAYKLEFVDAIESDDITFESKA